MKLDVQSLYRLDGIENAAGLQAGILPQRIFAIKTTTDQTAVVAKGLGAVTTPD
ncbi:MAG TPA: hypothetical protein VKB96_17040 [Gammaproteobacteria bacterium]|nr:hypothetical protein [Gammaproteobacteria bacterium]